MLTAGVWGTIDDRWLQVLEATAQVIDKRDKVPASMIEVLPDRQAAEKFMLLRAQYFATAFVDLTCEGAPLEPPESVGTHSLKVVRRLLQDRSNEVHVLKLDALLIGKGRDKWRKAYLDLIMRLKTSCDMNGSGFAAYVDETIGHCGLLNIQKTKNTPANDNGDKSDAVNGRARKDKDKADKAPSNQRKIQRSSRAWMIIHGTGLSLNCLHSSTSSMLWRFPPWILSSTSSRGSPLS